MTTSEYMPVQFFLDEKPRMSVCEVGIKRVHNTTTNSTSIVFRCTCYGFTPAKGCLHVREVIRGIKINGDGTYNTPMSPNTSPSDVLKGNESPEDYRELMLRKSMIRVMSHEDD